VPFHFAWVDANTPFDPSLLREDEVVLTLDLAHLEGQMPTLSIEIKNPRIGLLAPGRKQWVWVSWVSQVGEIIPLFNGRLSALPSNLFNETVTLQFLARPTDYLAQKQAIAETLKVSPYYDQIWIDKTKIDDPDTILESYTRAWHIDRVTLAVTTSDMVFGEDGTEEFMPEDSFYDSVSLSFGQSPQTRLVFTGSVTWTQGGGGTIKMPELKPTVYNGDAWISGWPKQGASLNGGWSVAESSLEDLFNTANAATYDLTGSYSNNESKHVTGDTLSVSVNETYYNGGKVGNLVYSIGSNVPGNPGSGTASSVSREDHYLGLLAYFFKANLTLQYGMSRGRTEIATFTMNSALQDIVTTPVDEAAAPIVLTMNGVDVGLPLPSGEIPLTDPGRSAFFPTDRGIQALQYPLLVARAHLLQSARAVKVGFECTLDRAVNLSCRKNAMIHDARLPGGQALGKITEYHIKGNGTTGQLIGTVQIESVIGESGTVTINEGTPVYVNDGYVAVGYQFYADATINLPTNDITFSVPVSGVTDDGLVLPLSYGQVVVKYQVQQGKPSPNLPGMPATRASSPPINSVAAGGAQTAADHNDKLMQQAQTLFDEFVAANQTWLEIELKSVAGTDYAAEYDISVGTLIVPTMINLEAPSAES
jgi:hypothetical protein